MINLVRNKMLYERYIIFENDGQNILLIDTNDGRGAELYLWELNIWNCIYDVNEDYRLKIIGVDLV